MNTPSSIYVPWQAVKIFLEDCTVDKINFIKGNKADKMFEHINQAQIEERFSGSATNKTD